MCGSRCDLVHAKSALQGLPYHILKTTRLFITEAYYCHDKIKKNPTVVIT